MAKDYKDTLNLPQTDFPMKANLAQKEPSMLGFWEEKGVMQRFRNGIKPVRTISSTTGRRMRTGISTSATR